MNPNVNATLVVDVDSSLIRPDAAQWSGVETSQREGLVNDNVKGGVQVQVHVKVNAGIGSL